MKSLIRITILTALAIPVAAQTINYTPQRLAIATSLNGVAPFTALSSASGLGEINYVPQYFVPMCSATGAPPFSQCTFGGGGTITSGPQYAFPVYTTGPTGTTVGPSNVTTDATGNNLIVPAGGGVTVTNDGVHPNQLALPWNSTANPAPTNATGWEGAVSATGTAGWFDLPSALPSVNSVWEFAAGSSNHSVPTQVAAPVGAFVGYASVGAVTWNNAGACTYNATGAYSTDGTVTTVSGQSCAFTPTNLVSGGYYTLIITNAASTAATFTLATSGSTCTAWKVGGAGGGAVTLSGASAIDILAFHMVGTVCYANFKGNFS